MKILVPVKRTLDYNVKVRVKADQSGVDLVNVKMSLNPFDEVAVEEAVRLKEAGKAAEVVVVTIGPEKAQDVLRTAMAIGADRGILIQTDLPTDIGGAEPLCVAKLLKAVAERESPNLIIMGKQSIDGESNQTGQMLATLLGWPVGLFVSSLNFGEEGTVTITGEVDEGTKTLCLSLPALVTADLRLNEPRYASLPNIMKAKKKELVITKPEDYGLSISPRLSVLSVREPTPRKGGGRVSSVDDLIDKLKNEAKVI